MALIVNPCTFDFRTRSYEAHLPKVLYEVHPMQPEPQKDLAKRQFPAE